MEWTNLSTDRELLRLELVLCSFLFCSFSGFSCLGGDSSPLLLGAMLLSLCGTSDFSIFSRSFFSTRSFFGGGGGGNCWAACWATSCWFNRGFLRKIDNNAWLSVSLFNLVINAARRRNSEIPGRRSLTHVTHLTFESLRRVFIGADWTIPWPLLERLGSLRSAAKWNVKNSCYMTDNYDGRWLDIYSLGEPCPWVNQCRTKPKSWSMMSIGMGTCRHCEYHS